MSLPKSYVTYKKYEHDSRKTRMIYQKMRDCVADKNLPASELFSVCFQYELLYNLHALSASSLEMIIGNEYGGFFIRRFLEAYAVLFADKEKQFEDINYKLFKIMVTDREIGKRESNKFKAQFKITSSKNFKEICKDNPFMFLIGATDNETTPFELLRNIQTETDKDEKEKEEILEYHRVTSCLIHFYNESYINAKGNYIKSYFNSLYAYEKNVTRQYLNKEFRNDGKLDAPTEIDSKYEKFIISINNLFVDYFEEIEASGEDAYIEQINKFHGPIAYFLNTFRALSFWSIHKEYSYIMCMPKMFFEKVHMYFELIDLNNIKEMEDRKASYEYVSLTKLKMNYEDFFNDEVVNKNLKTIYDHFKKNYNLKVNFYDFKTYVTNQPAYLIYFKAYNFTDLAMKAMHICDDLDYNKLYKFYKASVDYSHCFGGMIFKNEDDYIQSVKFMGVILVKTLKKYIEKLKKHPIIILAKESRKINAILDDLVNVLNSLEHLYADYAK